MESPGTPRRTKLRLGAWDKYTALMIRDEVRVFLKAHGIRLKKSFGQRFLVDESALRAIVETARILPTDHIIEIGSGIGILTRELIKRAEKVTAIELDSSLIPLLDGFITKNQKPTHQSSARCGAPLKTKNLHVIHANALRVPFPNTPYKIVANIPYHITSPLLRHAFLESNPPESLTLLIQKEVAEKIIDQHNFGRLTILVGLFGKPKIITVVPPSAFLPPPKVHSAVIHIESHPHPKADRRTIDSIFKLTAVAFSGKRKMLRNTMPEDILNKAHIDSSRRPQTLSLEEWITLAHARQ